MCEAECAELYESGGKILENEGKKKVGLRKWRRGRHSLIGVTQNLMTATTVMFAGNVLQRMSEAKNRSDKHRS